MKDSMEYYKTIEYEDDLYCIIKLITDKEPSASMVIKIPEDVRKSNYRSPNITLGHTNYTMDCNVIFCHKEIIECNNNFMNFVLYHEIGHHVYYKYKYNNPIMFRLQSVVDRCIIEELFCDIFAIQSLRFNNTIIDDVKYMYKKTFKNIQDEDRFRMSLWKKMKCVNLEKLTHEIERYRYNQLLQEQWISDLWESIYNKYNEEFADMYISKLIGQEIL